MMKKAKRRSSKIATPKLTSTPEEKSSKIPGAKKPGTKKPGSKKPGAKKSGSSKKIVYNRHTKQWERPKYMRKAEFERQLVIKQRESFLRKERSVKKLMQEANQRIDDLEKSGLESAAVRSRIGNADDFKKAYFEMPENASREDLIAFSQELRTFLKDPTSELTGAKLYSYEIFIGDWRERHLQKPSGDNFDDFNILPVSTGGGDKKYFVNRDYAKVAYSAYRSAIEMEQLANESMYDSETMIAFTFAYIEQNGITELNDDTRGEVANELKKYIETLSAARELKYQQIYGGKSAPIIR